jgi:hypothetical protein
MYEQGFGEYLHTTQFYLDKLTRTAHQLDECRNVNERVRLCDEMNDLEHKLQLSINKLVSRALRDQREV